MISVMCILLPDYVPSALNLEEPAADLADLDIRIRVYHFYDIGLGIPEGFPNSREMDVAYEIKKLRYMSVAEKKIELKDTTERRGIKLLIQNKTSITYQSHDPT